MCSSLTRRLATLTLGAVVALAIGCGHKDSPKPPPQRIPQPIRDLKVAQRGDRILISFTYPQTTISGLPIDDIVSIELWEFEMPVPVFTASALGGEDEATVGEAGETGESDSDVDEQMNGDETDATAEIEVEGTEEPVGEADATTDDFTVEDTVEIDADTTPQPEPEEEAPMEESADEDEKDETTGVDADAGETGAGIERGADLTTASSKELLLELDPRQFEGAAAKRVVLEGNDLSNAIRGDKVELELTLDKIEPGEKEALIYGVKTFQTLKRASAFSNLARIIPRVTPAPPADVELTPDPKGVEVSWTFEGDEPKEFRFYRRDPRSSGYGEHHGVRDGDGDSYLDSRAELGERYVYVMTAVINRTPLVESGFSEEHEIEYVDDFPPEPPTDLVVFSDVGSARLLWEGSDDDDLVGYIVYRHAAGVDYQRLFEKPIRQTEYEDTNAASGRTFFYRVVAVDQAGNVSDPSEEVQVRIP